MMMVISMKNSLPQRKHTRMKGFDYSTSGAYFVTICTQNRQCLFSRIICRDFSSTEVQYTDYGKIAEEQLFLLEKRFSCLKVDRYVIMPNHIHAILILEKAAGASPRPTDVKNATLAEIVCAYKSLTTRRCKSIQPIDKIFQASFYEHVIRGHEDYGKISEYIVNNPKKWELDSLYMKE